MAAALEVRGEPLGAVRDAVLVEVAQPGLSPVGASTT
jgi:hypothetical protein